jgi:hypothetical protein
MEKGSDHDGDPNETRVIRNLRSGNLSLSGDRWFRIELYDSFRVLVLDFAQIRVQPMKISAELSIELTARFAGFFNDWIFHAINLPSVPEEYRVALSFTSLSS